MKLHAIQTGCVRIKPAQLEGRGRRLRRRLSVMIDRGWTAWLATYAWIIDHPEGVIVVDTGQGAHLLESSRSLHPCRRWQVAFRLEREEEIGPQLHALGVGRHDIKRVVLSHLHVDHDGGLAHFPDTEILVSPGELRAARARMDPLRGYLPNRWPTWFDPKSLDLAPEKSGPFSAGKCLSADGDVIAVATPGHTPNHISVIVEDQPAGWCICRRTIPNRPHVLPVARAHLRHRFEVMPMLERSVARWIRADAAALFIVALWVVTATHSSWMCFLALFLAPDLSMIGYVFGPRVGAVTYNGAHLYAWPVGLLAAGLTYHAPFATTAALSWIAHIAFDNMLGYGLKLLDGFEHTVYGPIGRRRR